MRVAVTGASGLIGAALTRSLEADGHEVLRLVRREPATPREVRWDPGGAVDAEALAGADAVVHLAGAGIGDRRWNAAYKREIRDSRVRGTRTIAQAVARTRPRVLVCASAIGFYGDTGDREVDEDAPVGGGFLAALVRDWEAAAAPAREAGVRVALARTGIVLGKGGLLGRTLPLFRLGLGGRLGSGRQWMSWISLDDEVAALRFLLDGDLEGPVNLTGPRPVTNAEFTRALARAVRRPAALAVPRTALRLALGEFADEGALISQRVLPRRLREAGFAFAHEDVDAALAAALA
ncbi:epimerase [Actinomadura rubrobrunea]|uniref:Epimerase n=1 Tax=Actinomadura rubrobrunea TaxID=115335 RepID=A0A9W6UWS7_9ACTN|nr:TIGR01777 family oxidoreductase [Actinomadura rubrobrunea]GLW65358.1 epimerase [Actinomadura rubrobrunea]